MRMNWKKTTRKANFTVHLWLGLILGIYVIAIGITGAILSFKEPIEAALHPRLIHAAPGTQRASLDAVMAAVQKAHPNKEISGLALPQEADKSIQVRVSEGEQTRYGYVNPYTAEYLGSYVYDGSFIWWVYELHMNLLFKETGGKVNGIVALIVTVLFLTGLYLWYPATFQQLKLRLTVKRGAGAKRTTHDLHNVFGIYALPILILTFLTGAMFMYYEPVEKVIKKLAGETAAPKPPKIVAAANPQSLNALRTIAEAQIPQGKNSYISLATEPDSPVVFYFETPDSTLIGRSLSVSLNPYTGAVHEVEDSHTNRVQGGFQTLLSWHFGNWGGVWSHSLYALASLALVGLSVTGLMKYLYKRKGLAANRAKRQAVVNTLPLAEEPILTSLQES